MWMSASTLSAFTSLWGAPARAIHVAAADQLLDFAWAGLPSWAIVPFESLAPRWKVLTVDGQSPVRKDFDATVYPLEIQFAVTGSSAAFAIASAARDEPGRLQIDDRHHERHQRAGA